MPNADRDRVLRGRQSECSALDRLLSSARAGQSGVLVLHGEAGVGKSALLDYALSQATRCRVVRAVGVESEIELAFAGLHQLCAPMLNHLHRIPEPQQVALATAFGLSAGDAPDRFLVGLAVLNLVAEVADDQTLLCIVDDAQWLDQASAQVLAFVARRLQAEPIGVIISLSGSGDEADWANLPKLRVNGLTEAQSRLLLDSVLTGPVEARVRDRIVAEARGNPLALLELPRVMTSAELAFGFSPDAMPLTGRIELGFVRRLEPLSPQARLVLLTAAVEPFGDVLLLRRAINSMGIDAAATAEAESTELIELGARVRFRHPLVRSAVFQTASLDERRQAHRALAEVIDFETEPDRRAWHRAHAAAEADESVALELERSAGRAHARGGRAAAATFLEHAAVLTPDPTRRAERSLVAARAKWEAGALDSAFGLLAIVESGPADERRAADAEQLRGRIAFDERRGGDAVALLLRAAHRLKDLSPDASRETYLDALGAAMWERGLDERDPVLAVAESARAAPMAREPPRPVDLVLDAMVSRITTGYLGAFTTMNRALDAVRVLVRADDVGPWLWLAGNRACGTLALEVWDLDARHELAVRQVQLARDTGALVQLQFALHFLANTHLRTGNLADAALLIEEERLLSTATGSPPVGYTALALAALRGDESEATRLIAETMPDAAAREQGRLATFATYARAVLANGTGHHAVARDAALHLFEQDLLGYGPFVVPELAEAASRTGDTEILVALHDWLETRAQVTRTEWLLGTLARVGALRSDGDTADRLYRESIDRFTLTPLGIELARSRLLYGEWLRRRGRRVDARDQLRSAHHMLTDMGVNAFAERARRELLATGETVRSQAVDPRDQFTAQEVQITHLAIDGRTNPEIGAQLFISARTVEWHLRKVYVKLGISSRRELTLALIDG